MQEEKKIETAVADSNALSWQLRLGGLVMLAGA